MEIRSEQPADHEAIRRITEEAFGGRVEADLIEELRRRDAVSASLVAALGGDVIGHILFSPVRIHDHGFGGVAVGLAPMAVVPRLQRRGVGSLLVHSGLARCRELGADVVVVLGHADYYPRFGFRPAAELGLRCDYPVQPENFMALELTDEALDGVEGMVTYHPAFGSV